MTLSKVRLIFAFSTFDMLHNSTEVGESVNLDARSNTKFISAGESVDLMKIFDTGSDSPANDKENLPRCVDVLSSLLLYYRIILQLQYDGIYIILK